MLLDQSYINHLEIFCKNTGGESFKFLDSKVQPDVTFEWFGYYFWGYKKGNGFEIFGENLDVLEEQFQNYLEQFSEETDED